MKEIEEPVYVCLGRRQGEKPVFLQSSMLYTEKVIAHAHNTKSCGGTVFAMAKMRKTFWVPRLRRMTKKVIKSGRACKRAHTTPYKARLIAEKQDRKKLPFRSSRLCVSHQIYIKENRRTGLHSGIFCRLKRAVHM